MFISVRKRKNYLFTFSVGTDSRKGLKFVCNWTLEQPCHWSLNAPWPVYNPKPETFL